METLVGLATNLAVLLFAQWLFHLRAMAAQAANTRITVAAATGNADIPLESTDLKEVVKAVANDKKEAKEAVVAAAVNAKNAAETIKTAMNGDMERMIDSIVSSHVEELKKAHSEMRDILKSHAESDDKNMSDIRTVLVSLSSLTDKLAKESAEFRIAKPRK